MLFAVQNTSASNCPLFEREGDHLNGVSIPILSEFRHIGGFLRMVAPIRPPFHRTHPFPNCQRGEIYQRLQPSAVDHLRRLGPGGWQLDSTIYPYPRVVVRGGYGLFLGQRYSLFNCFSIHSSVECEFTIYLPSQGVKGRGLAHPPTNGPRRIAMLAKHRLSPAYVA
ncbi:hypothetical protein OG21DRAFT_1007624 [Imleria badia]|nr:hypothetical protein OG21DRAFT_1007624 [Imleria badia]